MNGSMQFVYFDESAFMGIPEWRHAVRWSLRKKALEIADSRLRLIFFKNLGWDREENS